MSAVFPGTPAQFIASILRGECPAASATVGASSTTYEPATATTPKLCTMVGHGNSLTLDYFGQMTARLAATQALHPAQVWNAINRGVGGAWTTDLSAEFLTAVQPYFSPHRLCLLVFCELTNHIGAGASFVTARDAAISYCATARGLGWKLAFLIPTPRAERTDPGYSGSASAWRPGQLAVYQQACDYFRAHTEHYDYVKDLSVVPELDDPHDPTYVLADGCHNTQAGIDAKAAAAATAAVGWFSAAPARPVATVSALPAKAVKSMAKRARKGAK